MTRNNNNPLVKVGKIPFRVSTVHSAVSEIYYYVDTKQTISIRLSNAYCVALASQDAHYEALLNGPGLNFPDGAPVAWLMRRKNPHAEQVRGPSLFKMALEKGQYHSARHFFLGSTDSTLKKLYTVIAEQYPALNVSGTYSPPFAQIDEDFYAKCLSVLDKRDQDIIWVALGTPKQDFVAQELARRTGAVCIAVGAAFDFTAGSAKEAPRWIQRINLEWLYRLTTEPKRLWRRYIFGNIRFLYSAAKHSKQPQAGQRNE
ncbi:WecB/TagA/CpsF family glycosyltransferase [Rhodococcus sp. IEGM 1330]|uniref:WecB/TagA/CpsF family glycosyltransferase n=1 Tax=Rhodococcus sp. IEGM 1330 TaxID=3082225 RepID=UPI002953AE49|nr:WecB/TagA/CpsF family glycosyltransferase [Rhodococcus sp. IEGM 1330]MDV8023651.1 WecB/TagA/CpsF family glycosyltransferase [Rhodococcus sp. IEGM 1330]